METSFGKSGHNGWLSLKQLVSSFYSHFLYKNTRPINSYLIDELSSPIDRDNEAAMIKKMATDISKIMNSFTPVSYFDGLVGMGAHLEKLEQFLCQGSDEVRMIGIWGPPGTGKTTIDRVAYNQLFDSFQLSVFMDDIKANYSRLCSHDYSAKLQIQWESLSLSMIEHLLKDITLLEKHESSSNKLVT